jgi:hypothetical protein
MLERRRDERRSVTRGYGEERRLQLAPEPPGSVLERRGPQRRSRDRRSRDRRMGDNPQPPVNPPQRSHTTDDAH